MTTKVKFVNGYTNTAEHKRWSPFLNMLKVPYGLLVMDGYLPSLIYNMSDGWDMLNILVEKKIITLDEAEEMEKAMTTAGLHKDLSAVLHSIPEERPPESYKPPFHFVACANLGCRNKLAHGNIFDANDSLVTRDGISTLKQGFELCEGAVRINLASNTNALLLLKQMQAADLPADDKEWMKRYDSLPEATRRAAEEGMDNPPLITVILG